MSYRNNKVFIGVTKKLKDKPIMLFSNVINVWKKLRTAMELHAYSVH